MRKQNLEPLKMNLQLFAENPIKDNASDSKAGNEPDNVPEDDDTEPETEPENDKSYCCLG